MHTIPHAAYSQKHLLVTRVVFRDGDVVPSGFALGWSIRHVLSYGRRGRSFVSPLVCQGLSI